MEGQVFIESTPPPLPERGGSGGSGTTGGAPGSGAGGRENALRKVRGPAIALIAMGALLLASSLLNIVLQFGMQGNPEDIVQAQTQLDRALREIGIDPELRRNCLNVFEQAQGGNRFVAVAIDLVHLLIGAFVAGAGARLLALRGRTMALFAAVVSMIPCITPCVCGCCPTCFLGIPVGVWVIATLQRAAVFDQYR